MQGAEWDGGRFQHHEASEGLGRGPGGARRIQGGWRRAQDDAGGSPAAAVRGYLWTSDLEKSSTGVKTRKPCLMGWGWHKNTVCDKKRIPAAE